MTRGEQETIVRWAADEDVVLVWTAHRPKKRKLEKPGHRPYRVSTQRGREIGWFYKIPRAEFRCGTRLKRTGARKPSEASLAALAAHRARRRKPVEPEFP